MFGEDRKIRLRPSYFLLQNLQSEMLAVLNVAAQVVTSANIQVGLKF